MELLNSQRQARLREQIVAEPNVVTHPAASEGRVGEVEGQSCPVGSQSQHQSPVRGSAEAAEVVRTRAAKRRVRCDDDIIPNDAQDFDEWIGTKMLELRDASDVGD